jgi:hypothetical protein
MTILSFLTTGLWVLLSGAFVVVFIVKYKALPTGILGAIGSVGHGMLAIAYAVVPMLLGRWADVGPVRMQVVFGLMNGLNLVASAFVLVAIALAPVPSRQGSAPVAPAWTPPPVA